MICLFPDPYPDELLYSVCARYGDLMQYPNKVTALQDFFGENTESAIVDLPNRISHLVSSMPIGHLYTEDELIYNHTLYPFYALFLPQERARIVLEAMRGGGVNRVLARIGLSTGRPYQLQWLRFCPSCVTEDKQKFGETYWHRVHQIHGIEVCPHHITFLEDSGTPWRSERNPGQTVTAENTIPDLLARPINLNNSVHTPQLSMAQTVVWLLGWRGSPLGPNSLSNRYYNLLLKQGLAYYNRRIRTKELVNRFKEYYSNEMLARLGCEIKNTYSNWLLCLLHTNEPEIAQHPIRHILLQMFLDCSANELFVEFNEYKPFGEGPWPCLNHASDHFGQLSVTNCRITDNLVKGKLGRPLGIFECSCGFIYNRVGPDTSSEDCLQFSSVQSYGPVWEKTLRELWGNTSIPIKDAAHLLGVSELTFIRHAIRLDLPMNIPGTRQAKGYEKYKNYRRTRHEALKHYRQQWQALRQANINASRNQLMETANFLYLWLRKNDPEWIEDHLPPVVKTERRVKLIDWKSEDQKLAKAIKAMAKRIKNIPGRPVRVTKASITREIGHRPWIQRRLDDLPLTAGALRTCVESYEAFLVRKVAWVENYYRREGICPTRSRFIGHAALNNKAGRILEVQSAVNAAMQRLKKRFL
jgi:hypothetical protein